MNDVELPPWATDAADFVAKLANALECQYVSQRLHHWIDLIFGYKSRGAAAEKADNLFHYLTYDDTCAYQHLCIPKGCLSEINFMICVASCHLLEVFRPYHY